MLCILNRLRKKCNGFDRKSVFDRWSGPASFLWRQVEEAIDKKYGERFSRNELFVCASRPIWELSKWVIRISRRISGTVFFPGGYGLCNTQPHEPLPPTPIGEVMVIGHNFDSEAGFERAFNHAGESLKGSTWRNILAFLEQVEISPERCFFTNAYEGLQSGNHAIGPFPGERDDEFVCWCQEFLHEQIKLMRPRLILTLGAYVPSFLAPLSPEIRRVWSGVKRLTTLDKQEAALVYRSTFADVLRPTAVVALTHPAYHHVNVKYRRFGNLKGEAAEQALVRDAITRREHG
jgi:uracil-DNA glycosylase